MHENLLNSLHLTLHLKILNFYINLKKNNQVAHTLELLSRRYFHWKYKPKIKLVLFLILLNKHCRNGKDYNNKKKLWNIIKDMFEFELCFPMP